MAIRVRQAVIFSLNSLMPANFSSSIRRSWLRNRIYLSRRKIFRVFFLTKRYSCKSCNKMISKKKKIIPYKYNSKIVVVITSSG